jgi:hypothetical protein
MALLYAKNEMQSLLQANGTQMKLNDSLGSSRGKPLTLLLAHGRFAAHKKEPNIKCPGFLGRWQIAENN